MATQPTAHRLRVPGAEIYYEVRGSGPLLLVVGQPMTSGPFAPLADLLAPDHTVVTYDPRGVGESTVADPLLDVTPELEADDLARVIDAVGGGPADVFGSSGGAVAGLALVVRHPGHVRTLVAHEPPITELLPDAVHVRAAIDDVEDAYHRGGSGAAWPAFVSVVTHDGPVGEDGIPPMSWPPSDAPADGGGGGGEDGAEATHEASPKQAADDELFFLRMLKPFSRWSPPLDTLQAHGAVVVAVGDSSGGQIARRSAVALAERLGTPTVGFPGDHGGFMGDVVGFADALRRALAGALTT